MVFAGAATGVVRIQTSGAIWVGRLVTEALHICNEHFEVISAVLFVYCCVMKVWMIVHNREKDDCNISQLRLISFIVYSYVEQK